MTQSYWPVAIAGARLPAGDSDTGRVARKAVIGLTALLVALLLAGSGVLLWQRYLDAIGEARYSTSNLATLLDEHAQRTLRVVEVIVQGLADRLRFEGYLNGPDAERVGETLARRVGVTREVLNIFFVGADGRVVADALGSRDPLDLSERPYVKYHRSNPGKGIHISEPVMSLSGRGRIIVVSHEVTDADGRVAGIVAASVSSGYFQDFYRSVDVGPLGVVTLRSRSGAPVARHPPDASLRTAGGVAGSTVAEAVASGRSFGTDDYKGQNDGIRRITSFRAVAGSPFIASVGRAHADFLAPWWDDVRRYGIATLLLAAVTVLASGYVLRLTAAREAADAAKRAGERAATDAIRESEAQEHQARERLETILNRMPLGCMVVDRELHYTYWNPSAERILGHRFEDVKGLGALDIGTMLDDRAVVEARQARYRLGDADYRAVSNCLTKDGRRIKCEWYNTPLMGADGSFQGVIALFQDITERTNTEEALRQSAKMDALGQLTGGVAHDFNNLLTVIMANLEMIEPAFAGRPEEGASLKTALGAAIRGGELTRQLLAFARRQALEPKIVRINDVVEGMTRLLSRTIGENIETSLKTAADVWPVRIDPTQLDTAIANLVVNARDAMPGGGKLVIETANAPLDEAYADRHAEVTAGDYVALSISDTGTGMAPDVVERVFEPFFTTKEAGKGTGLGMSMVFGFVKQSGGHIKIYSEAGLGTTIRLYFPRAHEIMPGGINGAELALRARRSRPGLKVLITSGYTAPALASRMLEVQDTSILAKPYRMADLAREVRQALDRARAAGDRPEGAAGRAGM